MLYSVFEETVPDAWKWIAGAEAALTMGDTSRAVGCLELPYACAKHSTLNHSDPIKGLLARGFHQPDLCYLHAAMDEWATKIPYGSRP